MDATIRNTSPTHKLVIFYNYFNGRFFPYVESSIKFSKSILILYYLLSVYGKNSFRILYVFLLLIPIYYAGIYLFPSILFFRWTIDSINGFKVVIFVGFNPSR